MHVKDICVRYGEKAVLTDFSAEFSEKGITWLMGESGCGKTTLLRVIAGLQAYEGTLSGMNDMRISMVFQENRLFEELTPIENCLLAGISVSREGAKELLLSTGLEAEALSKKTSLLSGGMKRRTAIARALCADFDLLLMDEPFGGIDKENRLLTSKAILAHCKDKPIIAVTHDISDTDLLKGKIIVMN